MLIMLPYLWSGIYFLPVSVLAGAPWATKQNFSSKRVLGRSHILPITVPLKNCFWKRQEWWLFQNSSCSSCIGALYWTFAKASTSLNLEIILKVTFWSVRIGGVNMICFAKFWWEKNVSLTCIHICRKTLRHDCRHKDQLQDLWSPMAPENTWLCSLHHRISTPGS